MVFTKDVEQNILKNINKENMDELLKKFSTIDRLSGHRGEEEALGYIMNKLDEYGIGYDVHHFDAYLSDPVRGELEILSPQRFSLEAKTRSFSANCPEGIEGEIVYLPAEGSILDQTSEIKWSYDEINGKIVLSEGGSPQHIEKAQDLGAIGLIHMWPSEEDVIHEMISTPVWGTPTPETIKNIPKIPEISIKNKDGKKLIELLNNGPVRVRVSTEVNTGNRKLMLPVASIPGRTNQYVLLSGHIDSWYEGITDNAVGNALCLELSRVFKMCCDNLERGIKIAWWPGHSNGRYAGSTWYCDNFWMDLHENCVAYINADSPGSKNGVNMLIRTPLIEEPEYFHNIVKKVTGQTPRWDHPFRAGDNSFWGPGIPFHLMLRDEPDEQYGKAKVGGSGGGWWWHSEEDTYDKADLDLLHRDAKVYALFTYSLADTELLPINLKVFTSKLQNLLKEIKDNLEEDLDLSPAEQALNSLYYAAGKIEGYKPRDKDEFNRLLKHVGGILSRLVYSYGSRYYQDPAYPQKPLNGLYRLSGLNKANIGEDLYLFYKTDFIRQRNRFVSEITNAANCIEAFLKKD